MDKKLDLYAELIIKQGLNLESGEMLAIAADVECADLVEAVTERAYKEGARRVTIFWGNAKIGKMNYQYQTEEEIITIPDYVVASRDYLIQEKAAYLVIGSERPDLLKDIDPQKIKASAIASSKALHRFRDATGSNLLKWCMVGYPNEEWAQKIFPELTPKKAVEQLWKHIHKTMRMDKKGALNAWKRHQRNLQKRSKILNKANIKTITYKNSLGTDFSVDMPKNYIFTGAAEKSQAGCDFTANMPTEEVFSSPDYRTANGKLVSALPLVRRGMVIKDFWMQFKDGRVVDFGAKEGYETLKGIIETDEGSHYLGEIALVGFDSPIQNLKTLFYNTLYDENASCHFAIGRGFGACIKNGNKLNRDQLKELGINDSLEHVDFMVGTKDLSITATTHDGNQIEIFKDGDWVF